MQYAPDWNKMVAYAKECAHDAECGSGAEPATWYGILHMLEAGRVPCEPESHPSRQRRLMRMFLEEAINIAGANRAQPEQPPKRCVGQWYRDTEPTVPSESLYQLICPHPGLACLAGRAGYYRAPVFVTNVHNISADEWTLVAGGFAQYFTLIPSPLEGRE